MQIHVGLVTISDRAARGLYADESGPALRSAVEQRGWRVAAETVVPDERTPIQHAIQAQANQGCQLILTAGGTGPGPRDVTPEAVREIAVCELPGFGEVMRRESMKITPHAMLSRSLAAVVGRALVLCLPGKPSGAVECLEFVAPAVPHCLEVLAGNPTHQPGGAGPAHP